MVGFVRGGGSLKSNIEVITKKNGKRQVRTWCVSLYSGVCADIAKHYEDKGFTIVSIRII